MAVGTVVLTSHNNVGNVRSIVVTATASSTDGSFPTATLFALGINDIAGTFLAIATNPGSPAPTDNYDISLLDADALDRLGGVGVNRDTSTSERTAVTGAAYFSQGELPNLTLTITGNSVNSAVTVITLYYSSAASTSASTGGAGDASATKQDAQTALLTTIDADTSAITTDTATVATKTTTLAAAVHAQDAVAGASDTGFGQQYIRDDALSAITPAEGDWAFGRVDANGAQWVQLAGALAPATDGVYIGASASGGYSEYPFLDLDEGAAEVVKAGAGKLGGFIVTNLHSATIFFKVWNRTSATAGTNNADKCWAIPAGAGIAISYGDVGVDYTTGICIGATLGVAASDNTAIPGANLVIGSVFYK